MFRLPSSTRSRSTRSDRSDRLARVKLGSGSGRSVEVPLWVRSSTRGTVRPHCTDSDVEPHERYAPAPLRFHYIGEGDAVLFGADVTSAKRRPPTSLAPTPLPAPKKDAHIFLNAFVKSHTSRCVVPAWLPVAFADIDRALLHAQTFAAHMLRQARLLFGGEGDNDCMSQLVHLMAQCFDWKLLASELPSPAQLLALCDLNERLRPVLQHTLWPDPKAYPSVKRVWPTRDEIGIQYIVLCKRLRDVVKKRPDVASKWGFKCSKGRVVQPVAVGGFVYAAMLPAFTEPSRSFFRGLTTSDKSRHGLEPSGILALQRALKIRVVALISSFVLEQRFDAFKVHQDHLRKCGFMHTKDHGLRKQALHLKSTAREQWSYRYGPGGVCALASKSGPAMLVCVLREVIEVSAASVCAAIDGESFFSIGTGAKNDRPAWHLVRLHHHCRPMGAPEATTTTTSDCCYDYYYNAISATILTTATTVDFLIKKVVIPNHTLEHSYFE